MAELHPSSNEPNSNKKCTTRSYSYTPKEDAGIAKAWIAVSENAIVGTDQKGENFIFQVCGKYNTFFRPQNRENRTFESIKTRCRLIIKHCTYISAWYAPIERAKPTGVSLSDLTRLATALFNGVDVYNASVDCGKPLKYSEAWEVLRHHEKLHAGELNDGVCESNSDCTKENAVGLEGRKIYGEGKNRIAETYQEGRPGGRKRAKEEAEKEKYKLEKFV